MKLLQSAGCDAAWYADKLDVMLKCITDPDYDHTDCCHHNPNRPPRRAILVTCPFHLDILKNSVNLLKSNASRLIDKEIGRVHNNVMELGFSHVWRECPKRERMSHVKCKAFAGMGLCRSNASAMRVVLGEDYSWVNEVRRKLGLPVSFGFRVQVRVCRCVHRTYSCISVLIIVLIFVQIDR